MRALVKSRAEPGLWLEDVPEPEFGINDVLIRVLRTGICGTDLHIYRLGRLGAAHDPGAAGHRPRVRRRDRRGRRQRQRLPPRRHRQRRGPRRLRPLPQLHGRPPSPVRAHAGRRRQPRRRVRRVHRPADDQRLAPLARHRPRDRRHLRPVRQRRPHRAVLPRPGRGRADHRRRPDRHAWPRRSCATPAPGTSSSPTSTPTGSIWPARLGATVAHRRPARSRWPTCSGSSA